MKAAVAFTVVAITALALGAVALGVPPTLTSVGAQDRHPTATFSAPRADFATIYLATKPDRATDGSFLSENIETLDILADAEIQAGRWLDDSQVDPGTYYVMMRASPDFDACYRDDLGGYDPACADGYSPVAPLTVPRPVSRYIASASVLRYLKRVEASAYGGAAGGSAPVSRLLPPREQAAPLSRWNARWLQLELGRLGPAVADYAEALHGRPPSRGSSLARRSR